MVTSIKRGVSLLVVVLAVLFAGLVSSPKASAATPKELQNVLTDVKLLDVGNGRAVTIKDGVYQLVEKALYRFETKFDLTAYDGNLNNGDYFTFTIPAPLTVKASTFPLVDGATKVEVGTAVVTANGAGQGGTVKITLKSLEEYLAKTGGAVVQGVKGTFYADFTIDKTLTEQTITYNNSETSNTITHKLVVNARGAADYSDTIGKENIAKIGGVMVEEDWNSPTLGKTGKYLHPWRVRANTNQTSYNTLVLKDMVADESAPMQHIPEKLVVRAGYFSADSFSLADGVELKKDVDYKIEYNSAYTSYTLTILNPKTRMASNGKPAAYLVEYSTTSPANGTDVVNKAELYGNEKPLLIATNRTTTIYSATRSSKITTGGTIQLETGYRITLYKQDAETGNLLAGAEFEVTSPSGLKETIVIGNDGFGQSSIYSAEEVRKGNFKVVETKAPKGYVLDATPFEVTVGQAGVVRTVKNTKIKTEIPVEKKWEDGNNRDGKRPTSITVQLMADGQEVAGQTKELNEGNGWKANFTNLDKYKDGVEINYTVKEVTVPAGYTSTVQKAGANVTVTNTYTPEVTQLDVEKVWDDANNKDNKRPTSITVQLMADGQEVAGQTQELNEGNSWKASFTNLDKYKDSVEINYTVKEVTVPTGYTSTVQKAGTTAMVTNTYTPEVTQLDVEKVWDDAN
ncbi:TPA: Cna B-type domain-containing protein, partial [Streptococcus suis]|nr:Cna B-type domain-containing protein [Streptococcus suis]